ncbi:MAG: hypothetical protein ACI89J_003158 [Hyphomicrobiaceae bacterium]|jgi:hypothetical protein
MLSERATSSFHHLKMPHALYLMAVAVVAGLSLLSASIAMAAKTKTATATKPPAIGQGRGSLPPAVSEMRDGIIAAARTGSLKELLIPIQWNELPPDFGDLSVEDTIAAWKKQSPDGSGRGWLALLINLLEAPYAVLRKGPDIENNKIFIWPAFSELPLKKLSPALQVELLRLVSAKEAARMQALGHYDGFGLAIGADGTWHVFKKVMPPAAPAK